MFFVKHKFFFVFCDFATIDSIIERAKNSYSTLGKYVLFQCSGADPQWAPFCSPHNKLYRALFLFPMHATGGFFWIALNLNLNFSVNDFYIRDNHPLLLIKFIVSFSLYSNSIPALYLLLVPLLAQTKNLLPIESFEMQLI